MQISRLFETVYILMNRRHVTAKELAERFEVSVRTVYRDIEALSQAGVPVYATQGAGGGIRISDSFVLNKSALTEQEQNQIILGLQSLSATGHADSDKLLSRLGSLFNKHDADWIEVDFSRWENAEQDRLILATVKDAILGHHPITFVYHAGNGITTKRTANPVKMLYKSRAWYIKAYCHEREDYRTFKMVRMTDIRMLSKTFDKAALPPLPVYVPDNAPPPTDIPMVLKFQPRITWRVLDEFNLSLITWEEDGSITAHVHFPCDDWTLGYILSFGTAVEVISPAHMREKVKQSLRELTAQYEKPDET